jgi:cytochrome b6-f complex iron-sulfur subunit
MSLNRRQFIVLSVAAMAGCQAGGGGAGEGGGENQPPVFSTVLIDAGSVNAYASDGVYDGFANQGFFVVRQKDRLFVLSSMCTHRRCKLRTAPEDHTFYCRCHGSVFDPNGKVTEGPAIRDLPVLPSSVDSSGHLIVHAVTG